MPTIKKEPKKIVEETLSANQNNNSDLPTIPARLNQLINTAKQNITETEAWTFAEAIPESLQNWTWKGDDAAPIKRHPGKPPKKKPILNPQPILDTFINMN